MRRRFVHAFRKMYAAMLCALVSLSTYTTEGALTTNASPPKWVVLQPEISAITIGVGFRNDTHGWTTAADSTNLPHIASTSDGGVTWAPVNSTTGTIMIVTAVAAARESQSAAIDVQVFGVPLASKFSIDGANFKESIGAPIAGQDAKYQAGRMVLAGPSGPCISTRGGLYTCHRVPLKNEATGRYASSPSKDVIYFSAGNWPRAGPPPTRPTSTTSSSTAATTSAHITRNLRVVASAGGGAPSLETGMEARSSSSAGGPEAQNLTIYTAELWKSTDGGESWRNLLSNELNYYFNGQSQSGPS